MKKYIYKHTKVEVNAFQYEGDLKDRNGNYYFPEWAVKLFEDNIIFYEADKLYILFSNGADREIVSVGDYIVLEDDNGRKKILIYSPKEFNKYFQEIDSDKVFKALDVSSIEDAKSKISDIKVIGDGDTFKVLCKASSEMQGWMKSTKVANLPNGCLVQVSTQQRNPDGSYSLAEALTFVPDVRMDTKMLTDDYGEYTGEEVNIFKRFNYV